MGMPVYRAVPYHAVQEGCFSGGAFCRGCFSQRVDLFGKGLVFVSEKLAQVYGKR